MSAVVDTVKVGLVVLLAAILQVTIFGAIDVSGGGPDLVLVTLVAVALLRGAVAGACAGFFGGLVADVATLETLGLTSLVLTVAGYWIGRYGETTGRDRAHAPVLSVVVVTILYTVGAFVLHFVLGDAVSTRRALLTSVPPTILFNVLLTVPVYTFVRRVVHATEGREVRVLA